MRRLSNLSGDDFLEGVGALAAGVEGVHKMHIAGWECVLLVQTGDTANMTSVVARICNELGQ